MDESTPILNRVEAELLQQRLMLLYKDGPARPEFGICTNIDEEFDQNWDHWLEHMFQSWPHYSGCEAYPVPHPVYPGNDVMALDCYHCAGNKWEGAYGELRIELLEFLITNLTDQLNEGYHNAP